MNTKSPFWKLWGIPILLGVSSIFGLLCALIGDGPWDVLSWLLLGLLIIVIAYFWARPSSEREN